MSIFCGIISLEKGAEPPESWIKLFRREISRNGTGNQFEYSDGQFYILKLDVGALAGTGWLHEHNEFIGALAGDPVFPERKISKDRNDDLRRIVRADESDLVAMLREARGNYSFARYRPNEDVILVGTDRLGLRPIYWMRVGNYLIFSGAMRILLKIPEHSFDADMRGVIESLAFGFPLGDRTEYSGLNILEGGDFLRIESGIVSKMSYWDWCSDTEGTEEESPQLRRRLFDEFMRSIELRSRSGATVNAALSGGLDSRCVVGGLIELGRKVNAVNVSWPGSFDQLLARRMASSFGIAYFEDELSTIETGEGFFPRSVRLMREIHAPGIAEKYLARQLWGGNDGSISVGYVYVTPGAVSHLRAGRVREAATEFIAHKSIAVSKRILKREYVDLARQQPIESIVEILSATQRDDPGQNIFMFLLLAYQRKMMQRGLEDIDQVNVERIEPFFDTSFLALTCSLPVDGSIGHGLFHRWLSEFPREVGDVPWQAYPGHEACPHELPVEGNSQWDYYSKVIRPAQRKKILSDFDSIMRQSRIAIEIIDWPTLRLMRIGRHICALDGDHAFKQLGDIHRLLLPIAS